MRTTLLITLGLVALNLNAQSGKYMGVRAQFGAALSETSVDVSTKGGFGGGIGLAYMYVFNPQWDLTADATFSVFSLQSDERDFDSGTQTWTTIGSRNINFMTPEMTAVFCKSIGRSNRFKAGFGGFLSKNIQKTVVNEQANYWGNGSSVSNSFALNNHFLTGLNYGFCLESSVRVNVFRLSVRYKQGLANINTEGVAWRQNYLQIGATYFFGAPQNAEFKYPLDETQPYSF
jgi:hypothetical protein